jgi:hypothetical protein
VRMKGRAKRSERGGVDLGVDLELPPPPLHRTLIRKEVHL